MRHHTTENYTFGNIAFPCIKSPLVKTRHSSLVCADACLNIHLSFTWDSYKGFLLRHNSFSCVIVSQKTYTRDKGSIYCVKVDNLPTVNDREKAAGGVGGGESEVNNLMYTKRQKDIYAIRKHETTDTISTKQQPQSHIFLGNLKCSKWWAGESGCKVVLIQGALFWRMPRLQKYNLDS